MEGKLGLVIGGWADQRIQPQRSVIMGKKRKLSLASVFPAWPHRKAPATVFSGGLV